MQLVILAGGKGTRLGLTDMPKLMCPLLGVPLLERQINFAKSYGISEIFIISGYMSQVIVDYFGSGEKFGVKIHHIVEKEPLGTAGGLRLIKERLTDDFMLFYGDIVMDFDIAAFKEFAQADKTAVATLLAHPNDHPYDSDLLEVNDKCEVTAILPKPHPEGMTYHNLVNAAIYIFTPRILDYIEDGRAQDFGKDIFPKVLSSGAKLRAYNSAEYIKDMGTKDCLPQICNDMQNGKVARLNRRNPRPAVFLDRDGVLIEDMDTNPRAENLKLLPDVADAVRQLNKSDYLSIVVTNQPMIAKGFVTFDDVKKANNTLETYLGNEGAYLNAVYFCPHHPEKGFAGEIPELKIACECRKPAPGMLFKAQKDFNIDLSRSWMIGDRKSDVLAGKNAGCRTILVGKTIKDSLYADKRFPTLKQAVDFILEKSK